MKTNCNFSIIPCLHILIIVSTVLLSFESVLVHAQLSSVSPSRQPSRQPSSPLPPMPTLPSTPTPATTSTSSFLTEGSIIGFIVGFVLLAPCFLFVMIRGSVTCVNNSYLRQRRQVYNTDAPAE